MHSSLVRHRFLAFRSSDSGANLGGAGGVTATDDTVVDDKVDDKGKGDDKEKPAEKPEWRKRLDAIQEKLGGGDDDTVDEDDDDEGEGDDKSKSDTERRPKNDKTPAKAKDDDENGTGPIMVKVPGRHADDEEVEIPLDRAALKAAGLSAKDARDRIAHLKSGFARRAEIESDRVAVEAGRRELAAIETEMRDKPVAFFLDHVDTKQYRPLVEALITRMSDADFNLVIDRVAEYDADGSRRRDAGSRAREDQASRRDQQRTQTDAEKKRDEYVQAVTTEINAFVPEDWTDTEAEEFFEFATTRLQNHVRRSNLKGIAPKDIPELLSTLGVLSRFGLNEDRPETPAKRNPPSGRNAPPPKRPASGKPRDTAADLDERRSRKRDATTTPGGAGAAAAGSPPKGQGLLARLNFIRKQHGVPEKKYDTTK